MNNKLFLILTCILFSCGNERRTSTTDMLRIEFDTMMVDYQKVLEDVNFSPPVWDKENKKYYRVSYTVDFEEEKKPDKLLPEIKHKAIYLSVYDAYFELLAETPVPQLEKNPVHYFVREGDIWIIENIGDELGFIRLALH